MPLVANPNVRDPMSAPWSPVQSGPSTPIAGLAYLPAVTKFKRDNQLPGTSHTGSGLFTPLEGSSSSSPSPSDTATPEGRPGMDVQTEVLVDEDGEQHQEQATSVLSSPVTPSPEILEVESEAVPTGPSEDDDWGDIPRLPTPPAEIVDDVERDLPTGPVTRVFFQPKESSENAEGIDGLGGIDHGGSTKDYDALPAVAPDTPREENEDDPGLNDVERLVHTMDDAAKAFPGVTETNDPFKLTGNDSTVAPGAVACDNDETSVASSSSDEEETPR